jgi:hypothetical protein
MPTKKITFEVEAELHADDPAAAFRLILRAITEKIATAADPLQAGGAGAATDGAVRWKVQSWDERELATCVSCKRNVPRAETDITELGERCQRCTAQGEITQHWLGVEQNAYDRGYGHGYATATLVDLLTRS